MVTFSNEVVVHLAIWASVQTGCGFSKSGIKPFIFFDYFLISYKIFNFISQIFIDFGKFVKNNKQISTYRYDFMHFCRHRIHD